MATSDVTATRFNTVLPATGSKVRLRAKAIAVGQDVTISVSVTRAQIRPATVS